MARTTVPRRDLDREDAATVNSEVSKRQMTDEERKRIFGDTDKQQVKNGGVKQRLAAAEEERRQEAKKAEQVKLDGRSSANEPVKQEFLQWIAAGKSIAAFERQLGMRTNAMYYWLKKWNLTGIKPGKARELLGLLEETVKQAESPPVALISVSEKAYKELNDRLVDYESELARWVQIDNEKAALITELQEDKSYWIQTANQRRDEIAELDLFLREAKQAISELEGERKYLLETIEKAAISSAKHDPNNTYQALVGLGVIKATDTANHIVRNAVLDIETINFIQAKLTQEEFIGYCKAQIIDYVSRATHIGGIEDLRKAGKYIELATAGGV